MKGSLPVALRSEKDFRNSIRIGIIPTSVFFLLLLLYYPISIAMFIYFPFIIAHIIVIYISKDSFGLLAHHRLFPSILFVAWPYLFCLLYIAYAGKATQYHPIYFPSLLALGSFSFILTFYFGFKDCLALDEKSVEKRLRSVDWETGIYDVETHSLESVNIFGVIVESFPTWKLVYQIGLILSPGPIILFTAKHISGHLVSIIMVAVGWGGAILFGGISIELIYDAWFLRKMEKEKGVRLVLSNSTRANEIFKKTRDE